MDPWPLTGDKLRLAAALLKHGNYRTADQYLSALKRAHLERKDIWDQTLALEYTDCMRAVRRGLGPARQADPLPLERIAELGPEDFSPAPGWPAAPQASTLVASWWCLREVELNTARLAQATFDCGARTATLHLPVDKVDYRALGKFRTLACTCPSRTCPVCALVSLSGIARELAEARGIGPDEAPLSPDSQGEFVSKQNMADCLRALTVAAGELDAHITGHSPRVTGAQRMARAGISEWRIQLFAR